jgi:hypothetical protein
MQKEEVLERSRKERADEGMEHAGNRGRQFGFAAFCVMFIILVIFILIYDSAKTFYAISALFWIYVSVEAFAKYRFAKNKAYLVTAIAGSIASLAYLANYILTTLNVQL